MRSTRFTPIATTRPPLLGRRRARPRAPSPWLALLHLTITLAALWGIAWLTLWAWRLSIPRDVKVPEVVGMDLSAGMQLLEQEGLAGEVVARKASEKAAAEAILEAQPAPGRMVKLGRRILLTLSTGSDWTTAPDVRKMSVERAKGLLVSRSLRPGQEKVDFHPEVPAGYVIQQSPLPGTRLKRDSFVHLQVSKGPRPPEAGSEEPGPPAVKSGEVSLVVPPGARLQEVKIVVEDGKGEHTIYEEFHHPGEAVTCPVSGEGERVTAKVYVSGELLLEKEL